MRRRAALTLALATFLVSGVVAASEGYPEAMKTDLGLAKAPGCDLCHQAAAAPVGPASTLFGKSMVAKGLVASDPASLTKALDAMRAAGVDSDGDGAEDLDELSWGGDPNVASVPEGGAQEPVTYGCTAGRVPVEGGGVGLALGALALLLVRRGRRP
jgi:cytochrome c551/c552